MVDDDLSLAGGEESCDENSPQARAPFSSHPDVNSNLDAARRVNLSFDLTPGRRLRLTFENLTAEGEALDPGEGETIILDSGESGASSVDVSLRLSESGEPVVLDIPTQPGQTYHQRRASRLAAVGSAWRTRLAAWPYTLETTLFGLALCLYLLTRLIGLSAFPIYFFSDEAVQTVLAIDLLRENFQNQDGEFLPTYFNNVDKYSLSTTVYIQVLPYLLFGKSVLVTRATSVLIAMLAALYVGLILRDIFELPYWWSATMLLSITPAWYFHSRTAFETTTMVAFYCAGLYYYLSYRYRAPRYLYLALMMFALAFYTYSPGRVVVVLTGLLLLFSDIRYHWRNRRTGLLGVGLIVMLALPYLRFTINHPTAAADQLATLGSYWLRPIPLQEKLALYWKEYLYGLSPGYWFIPNQRDLPRHLMKDYGHLLRATMPLAFLGIFQVVRHFRSSAHRALLVAFLAAPSGAAIAQIAVTRTMVMVVPATLLTALGLIMLLTWLEEKRLNRKLLAFSVCFLLGGVNIFMTWDALTNGPTWFRSYGLGGMQYGGAQVYGAVKEVLQADPNAKIFVSPTWANGADMVARFFLSDPLPVQLASVNGHLTQLSPLDENMLFVMTPQEYQSVGESGKFSDIQVERILAYPDGQPGFYFARLAYVDDIEAILSVEKELRRQLKQDEFVLDDQLVRVRHSQLDLGRIIDLWDENERTVARTFEANPFIIELTFSSPLSLNGLSFNIGDTEVQVLARLFPDQDAKPIEYLARMTGTIEEREVSLDFVDQIDTKILYLEISDVRQSDPGHVHIWEINFH